MFGWIRHKIERERRTSYVPSGEESGDVRFTGNSLEDMIGIPVSYTHLPPRPENQFCSGGL